MDNVHRAAASDPAIAVPARAEVTSWVVAMRNGISSFDALAHVDRIYASVGSAAPGLAYGWARGLLLSGTASVSGETVNLGIGDWQCSKCAFNATHDNHVHVTLARHFSD